MRHSKHKIAVVGAGIGGLSAAMRLAAAGASVTVFERADWCGGKLRAVPSEAGAVDAGPTVLTQRHVFDELFEATGASLDDYVTLVPEPLLARHYWVDGSQLDLFGDTDESCAAIRDFAGAQEAAAFKRFTARCQRLFRQFEAPVMRSGQPSLATLTATVLRNPKVLADLRPTRSLARDLAAEFRDPRLRQLFGRYATYVGGSPYRVPALLGLIWSSEQAGVWRVEGGMHALAAALAQRADEVGVDIRLGTGIARIEGQNGHLTGLTTEDGTRHAFDKVVFNGDPQALSLGYLGPAAQVVPRRAVSPRSYSAYVWSFAARVSGIDLAHHNVFFGGDAKSEFDDLDHGRMPSNPTLYVCAQDRGSRDAEHDCASSERFEIIMNGPAGQERPEEEFQTCRDRTLRRLACQGLVFETEPAQSALTTPSDFNALFPGSDGSLYGRSPSGMMATFHRPTARARLGGLYLAGGGAHPGAGVPMVCLSGQHAAEAIMQDLALTSTSPQMDMRGGTSTGSRSAVAAPSQSLGS